MTAARTLEGRRLFRENPLIDPIAGVATGTLDFDHFPTSQPQQKIAQEKASRTMSLGGGRRTRNRDANSSAGPPL
jgi:hypothetical protein